MSKVFIKNISNKKVMSNEGTEIGSVYNITLDTQTGDLLELVVKPDMALDSSRYSKDNDYIYIPFAAVKSIKDFIVIDDSIARLR